MILFPLEFSFSVKSRWTQKTYRNVGKATQNRRRIFVDPFMVLQPLTPWLKNGKFGFSKKKIKVWSTSEDLQSFTQAYQHISISICDINLSLTCFFRSQFLQVRETRAQITVMQATSLHTNLVSNTTSTFISQISTA